MVYRCAGFSVYGGNSVLVVIVGPDAGTETGESAAVEPTADLSSEGVPLVQTPVDAEVEALLSPPRTGTSTRFSISRSVLRFPEI